MSLFIFKKLFIFWLHWVLIASWTFLWGLVAVRGPLTAGASLMAEHGL